MKNSTRLCTWKLSGLCKIMYLDEILVVLHDDVVLVEAAVEVRLGAAGVVHDVELVVGPTRLRFHVDAVVAVDGALHEDGLM